MGPRAGLDWCGKSRPTGIRSPDCPAHRQSLYRLRYPAHLDGIKVYFIIPFSLDLMPFFVLVITTTELLSFFTISAEPILGFGFNLGLRANSLLF